MIIAKINRTLSCACVCVRAMYCTISAPANPLPNRVVIVGLVVGATVDATSSSKRTLGGGGPGWFGWTARWHERPFGPWTGWQESGRTALHKLIRGVVANRAVFSQFSLSESQLWCAPTIPAGPACGQRCVCVCLYLWGRVASDRPVTPVVRDRSRGTIWHTPKRIVHGLALSFGALEVEDIGARSILGTNIHSMTIREVFIEVPDDLQ